MTDKEKKKEYDKRRYQEKKAYVKEQHQNYYEENKERIKKKSKRYRKENTGKIRYYHKEYYQKNKEQTKEQHKRYYEENKQRILEKKYQRQKTRYQEDIIFRITTSLRTRLRAALKGTDKAESTMKLLGCSGEQLRTHLEAQFTDGMNWDNYGYYGWHIDHIRPCASFDLTDPQQQLECFHYTNLQPLWAGDNIKKRDKYDRRT